MGLRGGACAGYACCMQPQTDTNERTEVPTDAAGTGQDAPSSTNADVAETVDTPDTVCGRTVEDWVAQDPGPAYRWSRLLTTWIWDFLFRLKSYGAEHVPETGGFVFMPNHSSWYDQYFQGRGQRRLIRFMCKDTAFPLPIVGRYLMSIGAFPVRRGKGDTFALDVARALLRDGQPIVVYPEGTRYRKSEPLGTPKRGAARLALETGTPILPVATYGAKPRAALGGKRWHLPKVTTVYGELMHFPGLEPTRENVDAVRDQTWAEVQRLYDFAKSMHHTRRPKVRPGVVPPRALAQPGHVAGDTATDTR